MMRAAVRCAMPMPSPMSMMMFFALMPVDLICTTSKLLVAVTGWFSLCVALMLSVWIAPFLLVDAERDNRPPPGLSPARPRGTDTQWLGAGLPASLAQH